MPPSTATSSTCSGRKSTLRRNIAVDESQVLAKESEEALLYRDMQADLVQQILRRLAAIKPVAG